MGLFYGENLEFGGTGIETKMTAFETLIYNCIVINVTDPSFIKSGLCRSLAIVSMGESLHRK